MDLYISGGNNFTCQQFQNIFRCLGVRCGVKPGTVAVDHTEYFCPRHVRFTIKAWVSCVFITAVEGTVSIYIAGWVVKKDLQYQYMRYLMKRFLCRMIYLISQ